MRKCHWEDSTSGLVQHQVATNLQFEEKNNTICEGQQRKAQ